MPRTERELHYLLWWQLVHRCTDPNNHKYLTYGARGITVCERWLTFKNFLEDMGYRPSREYSVERIDNHGPYDPSNCRWATRLEQGSNKRNNHLVHYQGRDWPLNALARHLGMPRHRLTMRLRRGWPIDLAVSQQRRPEHARRTE